MTLKRQSLRKENRHYLIIGSSAAGISAIEAIREIDGQGKITVVSDEREPLYSRCLLSYLLAGKISEEKVFIRDKNFFEVNKVKAILGEKVLKVHPGQKEAALESGKKLGYDCLFIGTGAQPKMEKVKGVEKKGVFGFRTLDDTLAMLKIMPEVKNAIILGGGLIGLRAAYALKIRGLQVKVVIKSDHLLSQVIDSGAAAIIEERLRENGLEVLKGLEAREILGKEKVEAVGLSSGEELPAQLVIIGKGVSPNIELVKETKVKTEWGILVNEKLKTSCPDIYAAGDVAQTEDIISGASAINAIWPCAVEQGRVAGWNMAGRDEIYPGSIAMNSVDFFGLPVIAVGLVRIKDSSGFEEVIRRPHTKDFGMGVYQKYVFKADRLAGVILVGDIRNAGVLGLVMRKKLDITDLKKDITEGKLDYARLLDRIKEEKDKFPEKEFQDTILTYPEKV